MASSLFFTPPLIASSSFRTPRPSANLKHCRIACKAATPENNDQQKQQRRANLDRREVLVGLGGLAGLTTASSAKSLAASGGPIQAPDLAKCHDPDDLPDGATAECCPPIPMQVKDYKPTKLRVRSPAHQLDDNQIARYKLAMELMRALPDDDPRSFKQQADVHCAYCNGAYSQVGFPRQDIQVHDCWLFLPFHRWQLYFYERILGKLIGDPDFALPFWNWDHPDGMRIPDIFYDKHSSLYDKNRNVDHKPPAILELSYDEKSSKDEKINNTSKDEKLRNYMNRQKEDNLSLMYRVMMNPVCQTSFFGKPYVAGDKPNPGSGSLENIHNSIHDWCGDPNNEFHEDMGSFYSSGRDPLFYSLHANVDRLWSVWKELPGRKRKDINDKAWLDSTFVFYDENAELVRVRVGDALDSTKLGYTYKDVELPWQNFRPVSLKRSLIGSPQTLPNEIMPSIWKDVFPITLTHTVRLNVKRPEKEPIGDGEEIEEVLVIKDIEYDKRSSVSFNVYLNDIEFGIANISVRNSEFLGGFRKIPHGKFVKDPIVTTDLTLGLTDALKDLGAEDDKVVVVTLVHRAGKVKIGGIEIVNHYC